MSVNLSTIGCTDWPGVIDMPTKLCIDCKHYLYAVNIKTSSMSSPTVIINGKTHELSDRFAHPHHICKETMRGTAHHPGSPIDGSVYIERKVDSCTTARGDYGRCGPDGNRWELKPPRQTWWQWLYAIYTIN